MKVFKKIVAVAATAVTMGLTSCGLFEPTGTPETEGTATQVNSVFTAAIDSMVTADSGHLNATKLPALIARIQNQFNDSALYIGMTAEGKEWSLDNDRTIQNRVRTEVVVRDTAGNYSIRGGAERDFRDYQIKP